MRANMPKEPVGPTSRPGQEVDRYPERAPLMAAPPQAAILRVQKGSTRFTPAELVALQSTIGNGAVQRIVTRGRENLEGLGGSEGSDIVRSARSLTTATIGRYFVHGGKGQAIMHRELRDMIKNSRTFDEFRQRLNAWADRELYPVPRTEGQSGGHRGRYYLPLELQLPPEGVRTR